MNIAEDIVINHLLVNKFGFNRNSVQDWQKLSWVDTTLKGLKIKDETGKEVKIPDDLSSEEYFIVLKQDAEANADSDGDGEGGSGGGSGGQGEGKEQTKGRNGTQTLDVHDMGDISDFEDILKDLNDILSGEEKADLQDVLEKHFQPKQEDDGDGGQGAGAGGQEAGKGLGGIWTFDEMKKKVKEKKKWETVIKRWTHKTLRDEFRNMEQWVKPHRRLAHLGSGSACLPCETDIEDMYLTEDRIEVFFFLDTSGSCIHLAKRFFDAAKSLPKDRFNIRLFCFDGAVVETELASGKIYGGGGTSFHIIENKIQEIMREDKIKYPSAVWLITDGYGTAVSPERPDKWYFFLSEGGTTSYVPAKAKVYKLSDFE